MSTATAEGLRNLPLAAISPNVNNPRKNFSPAALKELASSITAHGVLHPVLVRRDPLAKAGAEKYELVTGERRWRAAKVAGLTDIPAIVRQMEDREALEIMVIENLQREDVHPLEEALGYKALIQDATAGSQEALNTPEKIAARIGKSIGYVYARLKLLALIESAREAFQRDLLTPGHAVLIARLQPNDQLRALVACFDEFRADLGKGVTSDAKLEDVVEDLDAPRLPEKALRGWIQVNVNLRLKGVPWDLADADLVPTAGACTTCGKRSVSNPSLFAELAVEGEDTCFDSACYNGKRQAFVQLQVASQKEKDKPVVQLDENYSHVKPKEGQQILKAGQWVEAKRGECKSVQTGIIVKGENAGDKRTVCTDPSCKVHKHHFQSGGTGFSGHSVNHQEEQFNRHRGNIREGKKAVVRTALASEIVGCVGTKVPLHLLRLVATEAIQDCCHDDRSAADLLRTMGMQATPALAKVQSLLESGSESVLNKLIVAKLLEQRAYGQDDKKTREELCKVAKQSGIKKPTRILDQAAERLTKAPTCRECGCIAEVPCDWYDKAGGGRKVCKWIEPDLCSNLDCVQRAKAKAKLQTSTKPKAKEPTGKALPAPAKARKARKGAREGKQ